MTTAVTVDQLRNLTDRAARGPLTADEQQRLREGINQLEALQQIARGYCPECGRGDAAPTVEHWEQQKQRADEAERRLRNIANGHPRADSIQAEIGEMILQTHELRDQLRAADEAARRALAQRQEMAEERYAWQERGDRAETALARIQALADEHPAGIDTALIHEALDQTGPATAQATEPAGLRARIAHTLRTTPNRHATNRLGFPDHHGPSEGYLGWCALCTRDVEALTEALHAVFAEQPGPG